MKQLVVYFSRKGYVKRVATNYAARVNADLFGIVPKERIRGLLGFLWCGRFGMHRWGMPIEDVPVDLSKYDNIVICSSVWVFTIAAPMREFVLRYGGAIKSADYCLVHFSHPMHYNKTIEWLDKTLGLKHGSFTSISCMWGRVWSVKRFDSNGKTLTTERDLTKKAAV